VLTFSGTATQRVSLTGTTTNGLTGQILTCDVNATIKKPDGSVLAGPTCMEGSGFIDQTLLAMTGTYSIVVDPVNAATGDLALTRHSVSDYSGTTSAGGSVTVPIAAPGQKGRVTFSGAAKISLAGTTSELTGQIGCDVNVTILNPDQSVLAPATCME